MRTNRSRRAAAVLVGLEGARRSSALAVWQIVAVASGDTGLDRERRRAHRADASSAPSPCSRSPSRSGAASRGAAPGGIVTQLLILAVALGAATGAYADPSTALILAVPAIVALVLLVLAVRDAGAARRAGRGAAAMRRTRHPAIRVTADGSAAARRPAACAARADVAGRAHVVQGVLRCGPSRR